MEESYIEEKEMQLNLKFRYKGFFYYRLLARIQFSLLVLFILFFEFQEFIFILYRYIIGERLVYFTLDVSDFNCKYVVIEIWCNYKYLEIIYSRC